MLPYSLHNLVTAVKLVFLSFHSLAKNAMKKPFLFTSKFEKKGKHYRYVNSYKLQKNEMYIS